MMTSVLDGNEDPDERSPLLARSVNGKDNMRADSFESIRGAQSAFNDAAVQFLGLSPLVFVIGACHTVAFFGCLMFWLTVVVRAVDLGYLIVPAAWGLMACLFASPIAVNFLIVAFKRLWYGKALDYELIVFQRVYVAKLLAAAALLGMFCGLGAVIGGMTGQEYPAAAFAMLHVAICFSLCIYSCRVVAMDVRVEQTNVFIAQERRSRGQIVLWYLFVALACCTVLLFLIINGAAAYRLFERGYVFRHEKPHKSDYFSTAPDRMFFLSCRGEGAGPDSDVVLLLDADLASSSYGWAWLTPSLSKLWRTCVFDRPGYGWSSGGASPRTAAAETADLLVALNVSGMSESRFVYVSHGLAAWNGLMFQHAMQKQVVAMIFIDPFDPRDQVKTDKRERERLAFVNSFGYAGMLVNAFGFLRPFFYLMTYFRPVFDLPESVVPSFVDSISRQSFWETIVAENRVLSTSGNETLALFPFDQSAPLKDLPLALWSRAQSQSYEYFSSLSTNVIATNMTDDQNHFFIFDKKFAADIVSITSAAVGFALNQE